jgi:thiazole synthase
MLRDFLNVAATPPGQEGQWRSSPFIQNFCDRACKADATEVLPCYHFGSMTIEIRLNGETQSLPASLTVLQLLEHFGLPIERVAVEVNRSIVPKASWGARSVGTGDQIEVVHFVGGGGVVAEKVSSDTFVISGRTFHSRLLVGTGKYPSHEVMRQCHERSGTDMVTVAVRRIDLKAAKGESLLDYIDKTKIMILPNTAACYTADDAVRTARLGREAGLSHWVKLEVIGDEQTLFPDTAALIEATRILVKEGFVVLPYTNDDLVVALRLIDAGASAIMPLGAPIGSGMGIQNVAAIRILRERITEVPLIVDAGVGTASDAALAMELGADGVLMNSAIAGSGNPPDMAEAMNHAVKAGRLAYLAGRIPRRLYASASSPLDGLIR